MNALKPSLWWGAFTGFYKPGVQDIPNLDRVALFLYAARTVILVISAQAAVIAGLLAADAGRLGRLQRAWMLWGDLGTRLLA